MRGIIIIFLLFSFCMAFAQIDVIRVRKSAANARCTASLLGMTGGRITRAQLMACSRVEVAGPCDYKVLSYILSVSIKLNLKEYVCTSDTVSFFGRVTMQSANPGDVIFIEKIKVKSNVTGQVFSLPNMKFRVIP